MTHGAGIHHPTVPPEASLATLIPIYQSMPTKIEQMRMARSLQNTARDSFFLGPHGLDTSYYSENWPQTEIRRYDPNRFRSKESYSAWLLEPALYLDFAHYDFILICQADAVLTRPISFLENAEFDYLGAPWDGFFELRWNPIRRTLLSGRGFNSRRISVGNGGLSLRRTSSFIDALPRFPKVRNFINEDKVISFFGPSRGLRIAHRSLAQRVFAETQISNWSLGDPLPDVFGFHALDKFNPELEKVLLADLI